MSKRTQLSAQVHLVEAAEHLRRAQEAMGEEDDGPVNELDTLISDIKIVSTLSNEADGGDESRWHERQPRHE